MNEPPARGTHCHDSAEPTIPGALLVDERAAEPLKLLTVYPTTAPCARDGDSRSLRSPCSMLVIMAYLRFYVDACLSSLCGIVSQTSPFITA